MQFGNCHVGLFVSSALGLVSRDSLDTFERPGSHQGGQDVLAAGLSGTNTGSSRSQQQLGLAKPDREKQSVPTSRVQSDPSRTGEL